MLVVGSHARNVAGAPATDCGEQQWLMEKRGIAEKGAASRKVNWECGKRSPEEKRLVESSTEMRKKAVRKVTAAGVTGEGERGVRKCRNKCDD